MTNERLGPNEFQMHMIITNHFGIKMYFARRVGNHQVLAEKAYL